MKAGDLLKLGRESVGLTRNELAAACSVAEETVRGWKNGQVALNFIETETTVRLFSTLMLDTTNFYKVYYPQLFESVEENRRRYDSTHGHNLGIYGTRKNLHMAINSCEKDGLINKREQNWLNDTLNQVSSAMFQKHYDSGMMTECEWEQYVWPIAKRIRVLKERVITDRLDDRVLKILRLSLASSEFDLKSLAMLCEIPYSALEEIFIEPEVWKQTEIGDFLKICEALELKFERVFRPCKRNGEVQVGAVLTA